MEKFYIVTEGSSLYKDYFDHKENVKIINEHVIGFNNNHGIETTKYYPKNETLYIVPTENDTAKFAKVLAKEVEHGLRAFKKNSSIRKAWVESLNKNELKVLERPHVFMYFECYGRFQWRLFEVDGILYCSYSADTSKIECPEGFKEIKASEFYKVIEDYNAKNGITE